jgi:aminoglycoside 3-N-acetyltransferase
MNNFPIAKKIKTFFGHEQEPIVLVHSDLMHGFQLPFTKRSELLALHYNELNELHDHLNVVMPTFNYDFCGGSIFDVKYSKSQVGVLSEYFRNYISKWRTPIPVFSFAGNGKNPGCNLEANIDPFGTNSVFDYLYENNAWLLHYGSPLSSSTILHYAERMSGELCYRYDKVFNGIVVDKENKEFNVAIKYHVRPLTERLEYNWIKIEEDIIKEKILIKFQDGETRISICKIKDLIAFWVHKMREDPFYFLDMASKAWIIPRLNKLGRAFLIADFESI